MSLHPDMRFTFVKSGNRGKSGKVIAVAGNDVRVRIGCKNPRYKWVNKTTLEEVVRLLRKDEHK